MRPVSMPHFLIVAPKGDTAWLLPKSTTTAVWYVSGILLKKGDSEKPLATSHGHKRRYENDTSILSAISKAMGHLQLLFVKSARKCVVRRTKSIRTMAEHALLPGLGRPFGARGAALW